MPNTKYIASWTGAVRHSLSWLSGTSKDTVIPNPDFQPSGARYTIYCVHGTADRSHAFASLMKGMLKKKSLPSSVERIQLVSFTGRARGHSIKHYAQQLKEKILQNGDTNVILMGHSRGGLVCAEFTEHLAQEAGINVAGVIPICAPFGGSPLAMAPISWMSQSVHEMKKKSSYLTTLCDSVAATNESRKNYYFFGAQNDAIVPFQRAVVAKNCSYVNVRPAHGHLSIMKSNRLIDELETCLSTATNSPAVRKDRKIFNAIVEIDGEMHRLKKQKHFRSAKDKLAVLGGLKDLLVSVMNREIDETFITANTVGELVANYLEIKNEKGKTALQTLGKHLNFAAFRFHRSRPRSLMFVERLVSSYQETRLFDKLTPVSVNNNR